MYKEIKTYCNCTEVSKRNVGGISYGYYIDDMLICKNTKIVKRNNELNLLNLMAIKELLISLTYKQENAELELNSTILIIQDKEIINKITKNIIQESSAEEKELLSSIDEQIQILNSSNKIRFEGVCFAENPSETMVLNMFERISRLSVFEYLYEIGELKNKKLVQLVTLRNEFYCDNKDVVIQPDNILEANIDTLLRTDFLDKKIYITNSAFDQWHRYVNSSDNEMDIISKIMRTAVNDQLKTANFLGLYYLEDQIPCIFLSKEDKVYLWEVLPKTEKQISSYIYATKVIELKKLVNLKPKNESKIIRTNNSFIERINFLCLPIEMNEEHILSRWNERVSKIESSEEIIKYIVASALVEGGIKHEVHEFYCLQRDIICVFENKDNRIQMITTYGRISNQPALNNIKSLIKFVPRYGKINLSIN